MQDNNCSESEDAWGNLLNKKENEMFMQRKKQQKQVQHKLFFCSLVILWMHILSLLSFYQRSLPWPPEGDFFNFSNTRRSILSGKEWKWKTLKTKLNGNCSSIRFRGISWNWLCSLHNLFFQLQLFCYKKKYPSERKTFDNSTWLNFSLSTLP